MSDLLAQDTFLTRKQFKQLSEDDQCVYAQRALRAFAYYMNGEYGLHANRVCFWHFRAAYRHLSIYRAAACLFVLAYARVRITLGRWYEKGAR